MDRASDPSPLDSAERQPIQEGSRETLNTPGMSAEALESETKRFAPCVVLTTAESNSSLGNHDSKISVSSEHVSHEANRCRVKFDTQTSSVPASLSSAGLRTLNVGNVSIDEARPPDGGFGWIVVFAAFLVNLIADGVTFSFGVFHPHFLEYFGEGNSKTAWIASIFMSMPLLSGPIASFLVDRHGCQNMTIFGSLLAALGFFISAFVESMVALYFTFGVMAGFGLSLCYVAAVVIVAYYFDKKLSLATGISVCGSGIGTFLFAPFSYVLLYEYGWRGTTLLLSGCFLNMTICGLFFRDLPLTVSINEEKAKQRKLKREKKRNKRNKRSTDLFSEKILKDVKEVPMEKQFSSVVDLPTYMTVGEEVSLEAFECMSNKGRAYAMLAQNCPGVMRPSRSLSNSGKIHEESLAMAEIPPGVSSPEALLPATPEPQDNSNNSQPGSSDSLEKPPAFLKDLKMHRHSLKYRGAMLNINQYRLRSCSCPNIYRNSVSTNVKIKRWNAGLWDLWDLLQEVFDLSHLLNPAFLVFAISNFLLYMWYDVPYVYIAHDATNKGFNESQSSMLISIIGILNMFGEIILGWVGDLENVNTSMVYAICMVLCGAVLMLQPLLTSYYALASVSGAFGLFISANYSLMSVILVFKITLGKFTNAYGLLLLIQGLANLIGPPLAGWIYDETASYDLPFYLAGVFIILSGLILMVDPLYTRMRSRNTDNQATPDLLVESPSGEPSDRSSGKPSGKLSGEPSGKSSSKPSGEPKQKASMV